MLGSTDASRPHLGLVRLREDLRMIRATCLDAETLRLRIDARLRIWELEERGMSPHHLFPEAFPWEPGSA